MDGMGINNDIWRAGLACLSWVYSNHKVIMSTDIKNTYYKEAVLINLAKLPTINILHCLNLLRFPMISQNFLSKYFPHLSLWAPPSTKDAWLLTRTCSILNCLGISLTTSLGGDLKLLIRGSLGSLCHYGCPGPLSPIMGSSWPQWMKRLPNEPHNIQLINVTKVLSINKQIRQ